MNTTITGCGIVLFFVVAFVVVLFIAHYDPDDGGWE